MLNFSIRKSQQEAIDKTIEYFIDNQANSPKFLWNALMRWGKCFTSFKLVERWNSNSNNKPFKNVLILTFFPATQDSWERLLPGGVESQIGFKDFNFITATNRVKPSSSKTNIYFYSFQKLHSSKNRDLKDLAELQSINFDLLILDEYHFGAHNTTSKEFIKSTRYLKTLDDNIALFDNDALDKIKYSFSLYLSGTPYRVLETGGFTSQDTFTFTYFDEQRDRFINGDKSDYNTCPRIHLESFNIEDANTENILDAIFEHEGILFNKSSRHKYFKHNNSASFWLVDSISSGNTMAALLEERVGDDFEIINLTDSKFGNGSVALQKVQHIIARSKKPLILLSYNKLTLGVTIPEIESVVMLRDISTAELYMQAAARSKSQYSKSSGKTLKDDVALISFNIINDFDIFSQITRGISVTESEFLRYLPITVYNYDKETDTYSKDDISPDENFLDSLKDTPMKVLIDKNYMSSDSILLDDLPLHILEQLKTLKDFGETKGKSSQIKLVPETDIYVNARQAGVRDGKRDKINNRPSKPEPSYTDLKLITAYNQGYSEGYKFVAGSGPTRQLEGREETTTNALKTKLKMLFKRFVFTLLATHKTELTFDELAQATENYFVETLQFPKQSFLELKERGIFNLNMIDLIVRTSKSKEDAQNNYLGLAEETDYKIYEDAVESPVEEDSVKKNYIYIAKPSKVAKSTYNAHRERASKYPNIEDYQNDVALWLRMTSYIKIGMSSEPNIRLEQLNGYTLYSEYGNPLLDIHHEQLIPNDVTDIDFHNYLISRGIDRVKDDKRFEYFDTDPDTAVQYLNEFLKSIND